MIYSDKAKGFVSGLRSGIKGTVYEPAGMLILSHWIYESGHFESKAARELNNAGGIQWREGYPGEHDIVEYTDWEGKTRKHFKLPCPTQFFDLWKWFITRDCRYKDAICFLPIDPNRFIWQLAHCGYVGSMDKPITSVFEFIQAQKKHNALELGSPTPLNSDNFASNKIMLAWNYWLRINIISKRPETKELYECAWTDGVANLMGLDAQQITIPDDLEWINTEVEIDILTGKKVGNE